MRSAGFDYGEAHGLRLLGEAALHQGQLDRATAILHESLRLWEQVGAARERTWSLIALGQVRLAQDDARQAAPHFAESLAACFEAGDRLGAARCLEGLAATAVLVRAQTEEASTLAARAARMLGAAARLRETSKNRLPPVERPIRDRALAAARAVLGGDAFGVAWDEGQRLPLGRVAEEALTLGQRLGLQVEAASRAPTDGGDRPTPTAIPGLEALTPREREVLALIGQGWSNKQIAERLVISERTVEVHARNIRERLGLTTRAQMIGLAVQQMR
jgi:DNA-binding CsgD family transcriptional regulator